jgi:DNA polymerase-3 subunit gamma/tau
MKEGLSAPSGEDMGKKERELDIALKDPSVKSFMDTFKARVLSVKPIERAEKKE